MRLAFLGVKGQLMAVALHSDTLAFTAFCRLSASRFRLRKQARASTLNSISAPSLRWGRLYSTNCRAWGCGGTPAVWRCAVPLLERRPRIATPPYGYSEPALYVIGGCPKPLGPLAHRGRRHPPATAFAGRSPAWFALGDCRQPSFGSQVRNRLRVPALSYS